MTDHITDERLREIVERGGYCSHDEAEEIAAELLAARAEVERLRDMLRRLQYAVAHALPGYGVYDDMLHVHDHDLDALRERMDEASALLARHKETP